MVELVFQGEAKLVPVPAGRRSEVLCPRAHSPGITTCGRKVEVAGVAPHPQHIPLTPALQAPLPPVPLLAQQSAATCLGAI